MPKHFNLVDVVLPYGKTSALDQSPETRLRSMLREMRSGSRDDVLMSRIAELVPLVDAKTVAALAGEARKNDALRCAALVLVREMARHATHRRMVAEALCQVIQRADDLCEFLSIYWREGRAPLSAQVKKGLAAAFPKFDESQLRKYLRSGRVELRDVLFLSHAKPRDAAQASVWRKLIWRRLG
jgi:hypothetical protein